MRIWRIGVLALMVAALTRSSKRLRHRNPRDVAASPRDISPEEEAGLESFPASDPPSWTLGRDDGTER